ncbi:MAG: GNAT family N-acetyltransferase [Candidatus Binatia bacterium]
MKKPFKIRRADALDTALIVKMMVEFIEESTMPYPKVNKQHCSEWMLRVIGNGGVWVAICDRQIVGTIGCSATQFDWNRDYWHVFDEWFYVKPDFRKGYRIAQTLLLEAKKAAQEAGFPFIFSVNSGKDKRIDRFVRMNGFEYIGGILLCRPPEKSDG